MVDNWVEKREVNSLAWVLEEEQSRSDVELVEDHRFSVGLHTSVGELQLEVEASSFVVVVAHKFVWGHHKFELVLVEASTVVEVLGVGAGIGAVGLVEAAKSSEAALAMEAGRFLVVVLEVASKFP